MHCMWNSSNACTACGNPPTHALHVMIPISHHKQCTVIPIITRHEWWYRSSTILAQAWWNPSTQSHVDTIHHKPCMMISFDRCITRWYHSSYALHNDTHHYMQCMMITISTIACHSETIQPIQALQEETIQPMHYMMKSLNPCSAWWYQSSQSLHDNTHQHKRCLILRSLSSHCIMILIITCIASLISTKRNKDLFITNVSNKKGTKRTVTLGN